MPTLITKFNWGSELRNANPLLCRQLDEAYTDTAIIVNGKSSKYQTTVDPPNNVTAADINKNFVIGDFWVNMSTDNAWIMTSRTTSDIVNWQQIT